MRAHGIAPASIRTVDTIQTGMPLIQAGVARAILPDPYHASLDRFGLTVRRIDPEPDPMRALALIRPGSSSDPRIARLVRMIGLIP